MAARVIRTFVDNPPPRGRPPLQENWLEQKKRVILVEVDKEATRRAKEAVEAAEAALLKEQLEAEEAEEQARIEAEEAEEAKVNLKAAKQRLVELKANNVSPEPYPPSLRRLLSGPIPTPRH